MRIARFAAEGGEVRHGIVEGDYEAELAVIIGKDASNVSEKDALKHAFGYTCGNGVSARD